MSGSSSQSSSSQSPGDSKPQGGQTANSRQEQGERQPDGAQLDAAGILSRAAQVALAESLQEEVRLAAEAALDGQS